jgi:hypothetical protein
MTIFHVTDERPWVVVIHAGTDKEEIIKYCETQKAARDHMHYCCIEEDNADVMKVSGPGTLTTEF